MINAVGDVLIVAAGLAALGAGLLLLTWHSAAAQAGAAFANASWFDLVRQGMGLYFMARGLQVLGRAMREWKPSTT